MKNSLEHLPQDKQEKISDVVEIIKKEVSPEMIILFGSYARGDWVEERPPNMESGPFYQYQSDIDLLVVTKDAHTANNRRLWDRIRSITSNAVDLPITAIAHEIEYLNEKLSEGQYFFSDIRKEGVMLFDSNDFQLAEVRAMSTFERKQIAQKHFERWFESADEFYGIYGFTLSKSQFNKAAFSLHQTCEHLFHCISLVFTDYKHRAHDLEKLIKKVGHMHGDFLTVFPRSTKEDNERFELLRKAYIDSRYSDDFEITKEELEWLAGHVKNLQVLTKKHCLNKIESICE